MDMMEESGDALESVLDHEPIELHLCKGNILVWNADDVKLLREIHHIVGALVGSLPRSPRQNAQLSLPLQLMPEEAAVLIEYEVAKLVNVKITKRTTEDVLAFEQARKRSFHEQEALWDTMNHKKLEDFQHVIAMGRTTKKHRRAERAKNKKRIKAAAATKSEGECNIRCSPDEPGGGDDSEKRMQEDAVALATGHQDGGGEHTSVADRDSLSHTCEATSGQPEAVSQQNEVMISEVEGLNNSRCMESSKSSVADRGMTSDANADLSSRTEKTNSRSHPTQVDLTESLHEADSTLLMNSSSTTDCVQKETEAVTKNYSSTNVEAGREVQRPVSLNPKSCTSARNEVHINEENKNVNFGGEEISEVMLKMSGKTADDKGRFEQSDTPGGSQSSTCENSNRSVNRGSVIEDEPVAVVTEGGKADFPLPGQDARPDEADVFKRPPDPQPCSGYLVHLVTASPATLRQELTEWAYPSTQQEMLKYRIFRDLWETGYYLTSGCKFGGDFLVYPGDPVLYHSYFIAICVPHEKPLSPLDLITYGRLGTNVKKTVILCSVDEENEVVYTSLQWTGFS